MTDGCLYDNIAVWEEKDEEEDREQNEFNRW